MYEAYFRFHQRPFSATPDPRFFYPSAKHKEALAHLRYGIVHRMGFVVLTGEVGCGKTMLVRSLLLQLPDDVRRALILNPMLNPDELLRAIMDDLRLHNDPGETRKQLLDRFNTFLLHQHAHGKTVVVIIDEAQDLDIATLEFVRLLSNFETDTTKLLQIVLVGQPELAEVLEQPKVRQLKQRITVRFHLRPLDRRETAEYISHRLQIAGNSGDVQFTRSAVDRIYAYSGGVPRLISIVCDHALVIAFSMEKWKIGESIIDEVIAAREPAGLGCPPAASGPVHQNFAPESMTSVATPTAAADAAAAAAVPPLFASAAEDTARPAPPAAAAPAAAPLGSSSAPRRSRGKAWMALAVLLPVAAAAAGGWWAHTSGRLRPLWRQLNGAASTSAPELAAAVFPAAALTPTRTAAISPTATELPRAAPTLASAAAAAAAADAPRPTDTETAAEREIHPPPTATAAPATETPSTTPTTAWVETPTATRPAPTSTPSSEPSLPPVAVPTVPLEAVPIPPAAPSSAHDVGAPNVYLIPSGQAVLEMDERHPQARFSVQVASFRSQEQAEVCARDMTRRLAQTISVIEDKTELGAWFRVMAGLYADKNEAEALLREVKKIPLYSDAYVVINRWHQAPVRRPLP